MPYCVSTNQRRVLRWRLAVAGITQADLHRSTRRDPIVLSGSKIDVTIDQHGPIVHFCRSDWGADGLTPNLSNEALSESHIEFLCPIPTEGNRYRVDAELSWDPQTQMVVIVITKFTFETETPEDVAIVLDDVNPADAFVEPPQEHNEPLSALLALV